jgi:adhesin transport system outer membrane protein
MNIKKMVISSCLIVPIFINAMSIEQLAQKSLNDNPLVQQHMGELKDVIYNLDKVKAGYKPTLDLYGDIGKQKIKKETATLSTNNTQNTSNISLVMRENIFNGFFTKYGVLEGEAAIFGARHYMLQETNTYLVNVMEKYLSVEKNKRLLEIEELKSQTYGRINQMIREKVNASIGKYADLEQSQSKLILSYANVITQKNNYKDSILNLERLFGPINKSELPNFSTVSLPAYDLEELNKLAQEFNPALKIEEFNIKTHTNTYQKELSAFYPKVNAQLSSEYTKNEDGVEEDTRTQKAMLNLEYNLYNGNFDETKKLQNIEKTRTLKFKLEDTKRKVREKLGLAVASYTHNRDKVNCLKLHVQLTGNTVNVYSEEYYLGRRTLIDLLNIEEEYSNAKKELVVAEHELHYSLFRILEAVGVIGYTLNTDIYDIVGLDKPIFENSILKDFQKTGDSDKCSIDNLQSSQNIENIKIIKNTKEKLDDNKSNSYGVVIDNTQENTVAVETSIEVNFNYKSIEIDEKTKASLKMLKNKIKEHKNVLLTINGHTDNIGSAPYNKNLSLSRAKAIRDYLILIGLDKERIVIQGHGFSKPIASNETEEGRTKNRRVEFVLEKIKNISEKM